MCWSNLSWVQNSIKSFFFFYQAIQSANALQHSNTLFNVFIDFYLFFIGVYLLNAIIVNFCFDLCNEKIWMIYNKHFFRGLLILLPITLQKQLMHYKTFNFSSTMKIVFIFNKYINLALQSKD